MRLGTPSTRAAAGWSSGAMVARYTHALSGKLAVDEFRRRWIQVLETKYPDELGVSMGLRKSIVIHLFTVCLFSIGISTISVNSVQANEGDDCGFGRLDLGDGDCMDYFWDEIDNNDGFSRRYTIYIDGDNTDDDGNNYFMEVQCSAKKLTVLVYTDPVGMYPDTNRSGLGTALVRIDGGKIKSYTYKRMSDSSGIALKSPKVLTSAMLKGRVKIAFKIPAIYGYQVANFAISDFSSYQATFKSRGCPLS